LPRNGGIIRRLALVLAMGLAVAGCATGGGAPLSDQERCGRYGGIWQMGVCKTTG
jgi:hypothetical protein